MQRVCENCVHYQPEGDGVGACRRYAPRPVEGPEALTAVWPTVASDDYCGEFDVAGRLFEARTAKVANKDTKVVTDDDSPF